jgi:hypothetical protein
LKYLYCDMYILIDYYKRCGLKMYGEKVRKWNVLLRHVLEKQLTDILSVVVWKSRRKKYGKMKCFITSCTRKASNVAFQALCFETVRGKKTWKWYVIKHFILPYFFPVLFQTATFEIQLLKYQLVVFSSTWRYKTFHFPRLCSLHFH